MIKAIAVDMDGTFLDSHHSYDKTRFEKIYQQLKQQKIKFIVASGSQYYRLRSLFDGFDDITYVAENGAVITEHDTVLEYTTFDDTLVHEIIEALDARDDTEYILCGLKGAYVRSGLSDNFKEILDNYYFNVTEVANFKQLPDDQLVKFALEVQADHVSEVVTALQKKFGHTIHAVSSGFNFIDILHPDANKGIAISALLNKWDISPHDLLAFGDADNDIQMLSLTENSYAMPHSSPQVMEVAKHRAPSHEESGVLTVIEQFLTPSSQKQR
ncbi:MAG: Cof-type HAD-IIB family hydrolase [Micrococcaceae bacterium]